jgi:hypothetical protein
MAITFTRHADDGLAQATDPGTPRMELVHLASLRKHEVRGAVAARRDCPLATMLTLVHDSHPHVVESLALNPSVPRVVLESLASHRRESVRTLVARRLRYMAELP